MLRKRLALGSLAVAALAAWLLLPSPSPASQEVQPVVVTNFPDPQRVAGSVSIDGPVRLSRLVSFEEIVVPPVPRTETTRLVDAGLLEANGFPNVVLSLHGQVKGEIARRGAVGAILLPEQPSIHEAFREQGVTHFALEVSASGVSAETPYFASDQPAHRVGFQAYRLLLYNTTDKTVTVNLFAYLTN